MTARKLAILLLWAILASILWFNILLVVRVAQLEKESRGLFSMRGRSEATSMDQRDDVSTRDDQYDDAWDEGDDGTGDDDHNDDVLSESADDDDVNSNDDYENTDDSERRQHFEGNFNNHYFTSRKKNRNYNQWGGSAARRRRVELPIDFTSPVASVATKCVSKDSRTKTCAISVCPNNEAESTTLQSLQSYAHGPTLRENTIRGTSMKLSGRAKTGSGCAMSHAHKFIYVHVLKSGGMTIKAFLKRALCGGSTQMPCQSGDHVLQIVDCARAIQQHPDYLVFGFVRNPYSRFYSGYSMATMYGKDESKVEHLSSNVPSFRDFALHPKIRKSASEVSPTHYLPQTVFLFDKYDCPVFDYIGRLEHFERDLLEVLTLIGSSELLNAFHDGTLQHEQSTAYGSRNRKNSTSWKDVYGDEDVKKAVAAQFARDFVLLGYSNDVEASFAR